MRKSRANKQGRLRGPSRSSIPFQRMGAGDQIVKRITAGNGILATGAGTSIPVSTVSSSTCQSIGTEFASFAARYQQYRVRAIRVTGKATQPVQTATVSHGTLYRGDFIGTSTPGSSSQVLSDEGVKLSATCHDFISVVTWIRNPNARLWNPTSAAIPTANTFSWVAASAATPALTTATTYFSYSVEWEVEFRGSQ